jgi:hypothetical protein
MVGKHPREKAKSIIWDPNEKPDPETVDFDQEAREARARHDMLWRVHLRLGVLYTDWPPQRDGPAGAGESLSGYRGSPTC